MPSLFQVPRFALLAMAASLVAPGAHAATTPAKAPTAASPASARPAATNVDPVRFARAAPLMAKDAKAKAVPARWSLEAADLSLLDDAALLRKAKVSSRLAEVAKAAAGDDPIALYLYGLHLLEAGGKPEPGKSASSYIERSSSLGLARATGALAAARYLTEAKPESREAAYQWGRAVFTSGNAFVAYLFGQALMANGTVGAATPADVKEARRREGIQAVAFAAEAGVAPAQTWYAKSLFQLIDSGDKNPTYPAKAKQMLDKAVAQGDADAIALARQRAKK